MADNITNDLFGIVCQPGQMAGRCTGNFISRQNFFRDCAAFLFRHLPSIFCLLLCVPTSALAILPDSVQASYDVYKSGIKVAQIEETYTRDKDRYTLSSTATPVGLLAVFKPEKILINSSGLIGKRGLQPLLFSHQREQDKSKESRAEFDWSARKLTLIHQEQRTEITLPDGTQDRLSAMYQFMFLPLQKAATLDFMMTNGNKLDNYRYDIVHNQRIKTPSGNFDTMYLYNQAITGGTRTEIWLSTQHNNLPCKMVITDADGDQLIQVLSKFDIKP